MYSMIYIIIVLTCYSTPPEPLAPNLFATFGWSSKQIWHASGASKSLPTHPTPDPVAAPDNIM